MIDVGLAKMLETAPPLSADWFPVKVQSLISDAEPCSFMIAAAYSDVFSVKVHPVARNALDLPLIPPPNTAASLPVNVQSRKVSEPSTTKAPPPYSASLPMNVQSM